MENVIGFKVPHSRDQSESFDVFKNTLSSFRWQMEDSFFVFGGKKGGA
jgi:hypothetical protein